MTLAELDRSKLYYLATPYTKYPKGLEHAFRDAARLTARLLNDGFMVYCPIAHTHPIAVHGGLDPRDHDVWLAFDAALIDKSDALLVAHMEGWEDSYGIIQEIKAFAKAEKPIYHLDPFMMDIM